MPECPNCGHHLTNDYLRVFGDNNDDVVICMHCEDDVHINERDTAGLEDTNSNLMTENL